MADERNRLSLRIPLIGEMIAEGPFAILGCLVLAIIFLSGKAGGWW